MEKHYMNISNSEQINKILNNAQIYKYDFALYRYYYMIQIFNSVFENKDINKVAIWGEKNHIKILCARLLSVYRECVVCTIDEHETGLFFNEEKHNLPRVLSEEAVDTIVIASWFDHIKIRECIEKSGKSYKIIDLYECLERIEVEVNEFFKGIDYSYDKISVTLGNLNSAKTLKLERILIKKLIGQYFHIRDFSNAFYYIDKLEKLEDEDSGFYADIKACIEEKLAHIKEGLVGKDCIVLNWVDALIPEDVEANMPFLSGLKKSGIYFENAYAVIPYTSVAAKTIFTGDLYLDDGLYDMNLNELENSKLYKLMVEQGYRFLYFGSFFKTGIFRNPRTEQYIILTHKERLASTIYQWESLKELEESQKRTFLIIHNLAETHFPYVGGMQADIQYSLGRQGVYKPATDMKEELFVAQKEQIKKAQEYMDMQLQFYMHLYQGIKYHIIMSDHGRYKGQLPVNYREFCHAFLLLLGENVPQMKIYEMLSLRNLYELIKALMENNRTLEDTLKICTKDYVNVQSEDGYNIEMTEAACMNPEFMETVLLQGRGVITREEMYYRDVLGREKYYIGNDMINEVNNKDYEERINKLRELAGDRFVDIRKYPKYVNARRWYELWGHKVPDDIKFLE